MSEFLVKNATELYAAIAKVKAGDVVKLAAGNYGELYLAGKNFSSAVTFTSADPGNPAHVDRVLLSNSSNLNFTSLDIGRPLKTGEIASPWNAMVRIGGSSNVTFDNVNIHGVMDGAIANDPNGFYAADSSGITLKNSKLQELANGLGADRVNDVKLIGNDIHNIHGDGINFAQATKILIDGNKLTNFDHAPGQHPDAIQFWTTNTKTSSSDIIIRNNVIMQGQGSGLQGIFLTDQMGNKPYKNVVIENNLVYTDFSNGITLMNADGATIRNNTSISPSNDSESSRIRLAGVTNGVFENNVADAYALSDINLAQSNNKDISKTTSLRSLLTGITDRANLSVSKLLISGSGYQPPSSSPSTEPVPVPEPAAPSKPDTPEVTVPPAQQTSSNSAAKTLLGVSYSGNKPVDASSYGTKFTGNFNTADLVSTAAGTSYHLTGLNGFGAVRGTDSQIFGQSKFTVSFALKRDAATTDAGDIMRVHGYWRLALSNNGQLSLDFTGKDGKAVIYNVPGVKITDTSWHDVDVTFDSSGNKVTFFVDSKQVGQTTVDGIAQAQKYWDFYVGNPYGASMKGQIGDIKIRNDALTGIQIAAEESWQQPAKVQLASSATAASTSVTSMNSSTEFAPQTLGSTLDLPATTASTASVKPLSSADLLGMLSKYGITNLNQLYHG